MKLIELYCRGEIGLWQETLTDGSLVYYVKVQNSDYIPVRIKGDGIALCQAFVKYAM